MENQPTNQTQTGLPSWSETKVREPRKMIPYWKNPVGTHKLVVLGQDWRNQVETQEDGAQAWQKKLDLTVELADTHEQFIWSMDWSQEFGPLSRLGQLREIALKYPSKSLVGCALLVIIQGQGKDKRYTVVDQTPRTPV